MPTFEEFTDPRLVLLYDHWATGRDDVEFYLALADELEPAAIVDIGCGTGVITCELAERGHRVTGLDPAAAMLEVARRRPGAERVHWVEGDARRLEDGIADFAIMTAHVPQVIFDQEAWRMTLRETHRALLPPGVLAFESRNPAAQAWRDWTPDRSWRRLEGTPLGPVDLWIDLRDVDGDLVRYDIHYRPVESGEEIVSRNVLRFRSLHAIEADLGAAGFVVERVYGDWDRSPVGPGSPELIVIARRA